MSNASILALSAGLLTTYIIGIIVYYVLYVIGAWQMYKKAGEAGWKAIIPVYNAYILYKISWQTLLFWITLLLAIIVYILSAVSAPQWIGSIISIAMFVIDIMLQYRISKSYGHGVGFTLGLIFLNPIFIMILGLGSSTYSKYIPEKEKA